MSQQNNQLAYFKLKKQIQKPYTGKVHVTRDTGNFCAYYYAA